MRVGNALAGLAVRDLVDSADWYARLFGRPHDASPMEGLVEWRFPGGGWLQVFADAERAGHGSVTLAVANIEETRTELEAQGHPIEWSFDGDITNGAVIRDPDGNRVVFAQSVNEEINPSAHIDGAGEGTSIKVRRDGAGPSGRTTA
ncbi:VOC family protein [Lutibaculum baratangense]|uniref:Glyoxalase/bleomycin resistance protein/dioxygenase n=1 Tax=Lutibaculum baratangense AMV1 TaxID=631454 RepID=V4RIU2_9HYPH|nr:VOC family protein [Lutibaculum baratangense]ESR26006.1 Glyoxalase/bleomycin resistance protein/dioxygenase [Lutibaculum baratangense AMV1]